MKADSIFIDSNIWLYAFIKSQDGRKHELAKHLIETNQNKITLSTQVINEVCFNLLKKNLCNEDKIKDLISGFYEIYPIASFSLNTLLLGSQIRMLNNISFWDSQIVASAIEFGCSILYSEDMHHQQIIEKQLTITNPFVS